MASGLIFSEVAFRNGYKIKSNTSGDSDWPWCKSLAGKTIGRVEPIVNVGIWKSTGGEAMEVPADQVEPALS